MLSESPISMKVNELQTIQRLVARLRTSAYQGMPVAEVAALLDDIQYLLSLQLTPVTDERPVAEEFLLYIQDIERRYPGFAGLSNSGHWTTATK